MQKPERIDLSVAKNIQLLKQFAEFVAKIIFKPTIQIAQVQMLASLRITLLAKNFISHSGRGGRFAGGVFRRPKGHFVNKKAI
jgi:hypothetical protein